MLNSQKSFGKVFYKSFGRIFGKSLNFSLRESLVVVKESCAAEFGKLCLVVANQIKGAGPELSVLIAEVWSF